VELAGDAGDWEKLLRSWKGNPHWMQAPPSGGRNLLRKIKSEQNMKSMSALKVIDSMTGQASDVATGRKMH
jgi:hypothetical protein